MKRFYTAFQAALQARLSALPAKILFQIREDIPHFRDFRQFGKIFERNFADDFCLVFRQNLETRAYQFFDRFGRFCIVPVLADRVSGS